MRISFLLFSILFFIQSSQAAPPLSKVKEPDSLLNENTILQKNCQNINKKDLEEKLNRKHKFKEKVAIFLAKKRFKKESRSDILTVTLYILAGLLALVLLAGILSFGIFGVAASAFVPFLLGSRKAKRSKNNKFKRLGRIAGYTLIAIYTLFIVVALAAFVANADN